MQVQSQTFRRTIRRAQREAENLNLSVSFSDRPSGKEISQLIDLHCASIEKRGFAPSPFTEPLRRTFVETALARMFETGQARVFTLTDQGHVVGFNLVMRDQSWYYGYMMGFDVDYLHISPGVSLMAYMVRHALENGYRGVDFGMGAETYKKHWCNAQTTITVATIIYYGPLRGYLAFLREKVRLRTRIRQALSHVSSAEVPSGDHE